jgi:CHASE3 domain sensor protein
MASSVLAMTVGAAFTFLLVSIYQLRESLRADQQAERVLAVANKLERLFVDLETGQRGFLFTREERFLHPWQEARVALPGQTRTLERLVGDNPGQRRRAERITEAGRSYLHDYSVPLIDAARSGQLSAGSEDAATVQGKRRLDAIRMEFDDFVGTEEDLARRRQEGADAAVQRAIVAAGGGVAASLLFVVLFWGYLSRIAVRPVRRAAAMAGRLAGGDLTARMPETSLGEIGELERSFNTMATSLQRSRADLTASRARIVAAADSARRQIERNLHDGAQQQLVSLGLQLRAAELTVTDTLAPLRAELARVGQGVGQGARGPSGDRARHPPRHPVRRWAGARDQGVGSPLGAAPRARHPNRCAAARADRGGCLLRRLRSTRQRRQACAGLLRARPCRDARRRPSPDRARRRDRRCRSPPRDPG